MPSSVAHAAVAVLALPTVAPVDRSRVLVGVAGLLAAAPDLDAIGRPFGHGDVLFLGGHRAVTHSLLVALGAALVVTAIWPHYRPLTCRWRVFVFLAAVVASHGLLDTLTTYGEGIELFAPISAYRFTAAWHPLSGILPEVTALWLPALLAIRFNLGGVWRHPRFRVADLGVRRLVILIQLIV